MTWDNMLKIDTCRAQSRSQVLSLCYNLPQRSGGAQSFQRWDSLRNERKSESRSAGDRISVTRGYRENGCKNGSYYYRQRFKTRTLTTSTVVHTKPSYWEWGLGSPLLFHIPSHVYITFSLACNTSYSLRFGRQSDLYFSVSWEIDWVKLEGLK